MENSANVKIPDLSMFVRVSDFEAPAKCVMDKDSWIYASVTASSNQSMRANLDDWSKITFRPRVLRNVDIIDTRRSVLDFQAQYPFFVSSIGALGTAHEDAEFGLVDGLTSRGMHALISTASTKPFEEIMARCQQKKLSAKSPTELFLQLYIATDRVKARRLIQKVKKLGYKGLWITVDTPVLGKRTADRYLQAEENLKLSMASLKRSKIGEVCGENSFGNAVSRRSVPGQLSANLTWSDLAWIKEEFQDPIVLKGIQSAADARLAADYGCDGILLSNHGARQSHASPSSLMTLLEIRTYHPEVFDKLEVFVDGGLRDGADVLKAICLGAKAVGIGRPLMYALACHGSAGVEKCIDILAEELEIGMKLLGITSLEQATPELVNASRLLQDIWRPDNFWTRSRL